jgi:FAD-dependent oxidoreductase domain-containing protein 1
MSEILQSEYSVVIAGGGIMGCCTAVYLKQLAPDLSVAVIEPDPTYEFASTLKASGGFRRLFSCPENIAMSQFGIEVISDFAAQVAVEGEAPDPQWKPNGYLFIVPPSGVTVIEENAVRQRAFGVEVELLDPGALKRRYPSMQVDDLGGAALSPNDGWCDPNSVLQGFKKRARAEGVDFITDKLVGVNHGRSRVESLALASGRQLALGHFVIAAGAWSAQIGDMLGWRLPITPLPREEYYFSCASAVEPLPFVKDLSRLAFRPEGAGFSGGLVDGNKPRGFRFDIDYDYFDNVMWPALAHRFPAMEAVKLQSAWCGLYEQNELDGNPIIGRWEGGLGNAFVVAGFSGHGLMHGPAAGRGIAELIVHGGYRSIDLAALGYGRVIANRPYAERGIL